MENKLVLLENISKVNENAKINVYISKYKRNIKDGNYCIALPANENEYILEKLVASLNRYSNYNPAKFDPVKHINDTYEVIDDESLLVIWNNITNLIDNHLDFKTNHDINKLNECNLNIYQINYANRDYYAFCKVQTLDNMFKHKWAFFSENDKLKRADSVKWFILSDNIEFIVEQKADGIIVYVFNQKSFMNFFDYYTYMKELVKNKLDQINSWTFLESADLIIKKIDQKNVYVNLARIMNDAVYLDAVKNINPETLKQRLLAKCKDSFSENDFNGNKLIVTDSSLNKIMKMISKRYRYNVFTDTAEESE